MEGDSKSTDPTRAVIERVKDLRRKRGLTAQQLAERMTEAGVPWEAGVVTKLETGRRKSISVAELLALAYVLDVALVHLMISADLDADAPCAVTPTLSIPAGAARRWIRGQQPLSGQDPRLYYSEVPAGEFTGPEVLFERLDEVEWVLATEGYIDTPRMDASPVWQRVPREQWSRDKDGDLHITRKGNDGQH